MTGTAGLRVLLAPNPSPMTLDGTRTYLIGRERPVVIDPGPADQRHLAEILRVLAGARPVAILLTHAHPDHAAGAPMLAEQTGAPILMAPEARDLTISPAAVHRWLRDGEEVETDVGPIRIVATPGHTPEHLAFWWTGAAAPVGGALFVGDLMMGEGDTTLVAPPEGDLGAYLRSLGRLRDLAPGILFPAHGPPLTDPPAAVARYLTHRSERIVQVLHVLERVGAATPAQLVWAVYGPDLHPQLVGAAEGSLRAVLRYLAETGKVWGEGGSVYVPVNGPVPSESADHFQPADHPRTQT